MKTRKAVKTYRIEPRLHRHFVATVKAENKRGRAITVSAATSEAIAMWCSMTRGLPTLKFDEDVIKIINRGIKTGEVDTTAVRGISR